MQNLNNAALGFIAAKNDLKCLSEYVDLQVQIATKRGDSNSRLDWLYAYNQLENSVERLHKGIKKLIAHHGDEITQQHLEVK